MELGRCSARAVASDRNPRRDHSDSGNCQEGFDQRPGSRTRRRRERTAALRAGAARASRATASRQRARDRQSVIGPRRWHANVCVRRTDERMIAISRRRANGQANRIRDDTGDDQRRNHHDADATWRRRAAADADDHSPRPVVDAVDAANAGSAPPARAQAGAHASLSGSGFREQRRMISPRVRAHSSARPCFLKRIDRKHARVVESDIDRRDLLCGCIGFDRGNFDLIHEAVAEARHRRANKGTRRVGRRYGDRSNRRKLHAGVRDDCATPHPERT